MTEGSQEPPAHVWVLLAAMVLFWSANFIIAKYALREFPPLMAGALRFTLAGAFILPMYWWKEREQAGRNWGREGLAKLLAIGVAGVGLNQLFFLVGIGRTSVAHAALMIAMTPVLVLFLAALTGQERITLKKAAGLGIAVAGVVVLQATPGKGGGATLLGDLFVLLASLAFAMFTVFGKSVVRRYDSLTVNTVAYVGSGVVLSPVTLWHAWEFPFHGVTLTGWASLVYMALFPSLLCYLIYYYALGYIPATRISALSYFQPVLATLLAIALLGERLTGSLVGGGLLVLMGVLLAERS